MTYFNYVDIGTSNFGTSLKKKRPGDIVLLVEPIKFYLDELPTGPEIIKFNAAVSDKNYTTEVFYVSPENILNYKLPSWFRGCNSIGEKHPTVLNKIKENNLPETLIESFPIEVVSFENLILRFNIDSIGQLKIDTEGHDHVILENVLKTVLENKIKIKRIIFEYEKDFNNIFELESLTERFISIGYKDLGTHKNNKIIEKC